jgi:hypothetical protein
VQINLGNVDPATGRYTGEFKTFALCGYIRDKVRSGPNAARCRMQGNAIDQRARVPRSLLNCVVLLRSYRHTNDCIASCWPAPRPLSFPVPLRAG